MFEFSTLGYILVFTFVGSIGSLIGGLVLLSKQKFAIKISHFLAAFAAGTLLGTAFFDLLPEAMEHAAQGKEHRDIFLWVMVGIILFFFIERFLHWFHHHEEYHPDEHTKSTVPLIIAGDTVHNFLDGIVIALTFLVSIPLGIVTTLAVAAHEIPQEIGDFGLLLHKGLSRKKVIWINIISACAAFVGAILAFFIGDSIEGILPIALAVTAGFFIYISLSDLIPEIHHENRKGFAFLESVLLIVGIVFIYVVVSYLEHGH
jgi:zinc and cadmium transporter